MSELGVCARCGRQVRLRSRAAEGRICSNCASIRNSGTCSRCGEHRRSAGIDPQGGRWCDRCRNRVRRHAEDRQRRELIVAAVQKIEPGLDEAAVVDVLTRTATSRRALRWLADHVRDQPEALTGAPTHQLQVADRFVTELVAIGARQIRRVQPPCRGCGRPRQHKAHGLCPACYARTSGRPCVDCGVSRRPYRRTPDGGVLCPSCARKRRRCQELDELTAVIGEQVAAATGDVAPATLAEILERVAGQPHRRRHLCDLLQAGTLDAPDAEAEPVVARFVTELRAAGANLSPVACADCYEPAEPFDTYRGTSRCTRCAKIARRRVPQRLRGRCGDCQRPDRPLDQDLRCRSCRERHAHRCRRCDQCTTLTHAGGEWLCHRCVLSDELNTLLDGADIARLDRLRTAILAADNSQQLRRWLAQPTVTQVLRQVATGSGALDHASLDRLDPKRGIDHLRALLVAAGLLANVDRTVDDFEAAVRPLLEAITDPADRVVVRAWLRWRVTPRLRRRIERGQSVDHSGPNARSNLARVAQFLQRLHNDGRNLAQCRQEDVDRWFAQPGTGPRQIRSFLAWTQQHGHLPRPLQLPTYRSRTPSPATGDRTLLARRLLTNDALAPDDRVAGALVVFYAQPVTRIAALTTGDLHTSGNGTVTVTLAGTPVELIEPFATLVRQLPVARTNGVADQFQARWLFPGKRAGRHIHADVLGGRLRALDIPPRLARSTALSELAREIPPALLADLVGIDPGTAARWATITGGDWASYPAARTSPASPRAAH